MCVDLEIDRPLDLEEACPRWRWVALRGDSEGCPAPEPLGDGAELVAKPLFSPLPGAPLPAALAPYCVYELQLEERRERPPFDRAEKRLAELVEEGLLREFDSDCMALAPTATLSEKVWGHLERQFTLETSRPASLPSSALHSFGEKPGARLVLLDTQPGKLWEGMEQGRSRHGYSLGHMARSLLCTEYDVTAADAGKNRVEEVLPESCLARVEHRLAMPIVRFDNEAPPITLDSPTLVELQNLPAGTVSDPIFGGYFGSLYELGAAIWDTVARQRITGAKEPLVLNLSLGWNGHLFGGHEDKVEQMPVPVQVVYRALEAASCSGALVVAAAGNRAGGPQDGVGPLLPAAWEQRPAPGARQCGAFASGNKNDAPQRRRPGARGEEPLLYAVAGVTGEDARLANARPESMPPRVAFADHAVVRTNNSRQPTAIMTGSSVAAAVVSASAAGIWSLRPDLSRRELMELLEQSGKPLKHKPDFRFANWGPRVHRVLFCQALRKACGSGRQCFGWSGRCTEPGAVQELAQGFHNAASGMTKKQEAPSQKIALKAPWCGIEELISDGAIPIAPCPSRQFHGVLTRPWTGPQPQDTPCPSCGVPPPTSQAFAADPTASTELYIEIEDWAGEPLQNGMLQVGQTLIALDLPDLTSGDSIVVTGLDWNLFAGSPPPPVLLIFNTADGSVEIPVLVVSSSGPTS